MCNVLLCFCRLHRYVMEKYVQIHAQKIMKKKKHLLLYARSHYLAVLNNIYANSVITLSQMPTNYNATTCQFTALLINCINVKIVITDMQHVVC